MVYTSKNLQDEQVKRQSSISALEKALISVLTRIGVPSDNQRITDVSSSVVDVLYDSIPDTDFSNIEPNSRMVADLGAESIDYLDIKMRLEEVFGVDKIPDDILGIQVDYKPLAKRDEGKLVLISGKETEFKSRFISIYNSLSEEVRSEFDKTLDFNYFFSNFNVLGIALGLYRYIVSQNDIKK